MSQSLANAELAIMDLLWSSEESMTARELRERLYSEEKKSQHGTVQRLLQRLEEKGFVERDRSLSVHFFTAKLSRQDHAGQELESLANKLTAGSIAPLITNLVEHKKISKKDIERIREVLEQPESGQKPSKKRSSKSKSKGEKQ